MNICLFLDESGSTGLDFKSSNNQPYYLLGGIACDKDKVEPLREFFSNWENKNNKKRTKSNKFFNKKSNHHHFEECLKGIGKYGFPIYFLAEKKYLACEQIWMDLFDPEINKSVPNHLAYDTVKKQLMCNQIYDSLDEKMINDFLVSSKISYNKNKEIISTIIENLSNSNLFSKKEYLSDITLANNFYKYFDDLNYDKYPFKTLNGIALQSLISNIYNQRPKSKLEIYYDELYSKEDIEEVFKRNTDNTVESIPLLGTKPYIVRSSFISNFNFIKDEDEPLVRLADLIIGSVNNLIKISENEDEDEIFNSYKDVNPLIPLLFLGNETAPYIIKISARKLTQIINSLLKQNKTP